MIVVGPAVLDHKGACHLTVIVCNRSYHAGTVSTSNRSYHAGTVSTSNRSYHAGTVSTSNTVGPIMQV